MTQEAELIEERYANMFGTMESTNISWWFHRLGTHRDPEISLICLNKDNPEHKSDTFLLMKCSCCILLLTPPAYKITSESKSLLKTIVKETLSQIPT